MSPHTTRRAALIGTAVSAVALAVPAYAAVDKDHEYEGDFVRLFRLWQARREFGWLPNTTEAQQDASYEEFCRIEEELLALTPISATDLAIRIVVETSYGDHETDRETFPYLLRMIEATGAPVSYGPPRAAWKNSWTNDWLRSPELAASHS